MKEQTLKELRLIAEFMGAEILPPKNSILEIADFNGIKPYKTAKKHTQFELCYLSYNDSWDWLMPVVSKINSLEDSRPDSLVSFTIRPTHCDVWHYEGEDMIVEEDKKGSDIEMVYRTVLRFIEWFNKNYEKDGDE